MDVVAFHVPFRHGKLRFNACKIYLYINAANIELPARVTNNDDKFLPRKLRFTFLKVD